MSRAYVGLGANLGDREWSIRRAAELLPATRLSAIRETEPWGLAEQPRFLNAVAEVETAAEPRALLASLFAIEQKLGRTRHGERYGPRTIDLDLLVYGDATIDEPGLQLPHPRLHERHFVLEPLVELDPDLQIPGRGTVSSLLAGLHSGA